MMDSFRNASRNTMFEQWLGATQRRTPPAESPPTPPAESSSPPQRPLQDLAEYLEGAETGTPAANPGSASLYSRNIPLRLSLHESPRFESPLSLESCIGP